MKPLIVANWKCNPVNLKEAERLFDFVKKDSKAIKNVEVVICPPFIYLSSFKSKSLNLKLGGQDCFWEEKGAYTGEISPLMLKDLGCEYVIIGHSERRRYFGETNETINKKLKAALKVNLKSIFCVGETLEEKEKAETPSILRSQIEEGLKEISKVEIQNIVIAYEPVWAIGTGKPCSPKDAADVALFIRNVVAQLYNRKLAKDIRILYGGSVNSKNAKDYLKEAKMNGLLVGGASLKSEEFVEIIKAGRP